jgi:hypothetical protein
MTVRTIQFADARGGLIVTARTRPESGHYAGTIDLTATPAEVRTLFDQFKELVNGQEFTCADEIERRIETLSLRAVFENGSTAPIIDLQVIPKTGEISFKVGAVPTVNGAPPRSAPKTSRRG